MPFNQASAGSGPTRCKYLDGYNLIPSGEGNGKPPLGKLEWRGYSPQLSPESSMVLKEKENLTLP